MIRIANTKKPKTAKVITNAITTIADITAVSSSFKPLEISYSYFNYTGEDIYIQTRDNLKTCIKPTNQYGVNLATGIVIVKKYRFHDSVIFDTSLVSDEYSDEVEIINKAFNNKRKVEHYFSETSISYTITLETLRDCDNCVFVKELDIVVSRANKDTYHPYSKIGLMNNKLENDTMIGISFRWVTHEKNLEYKYFKLYDEIMTVYSEHDDTIEDGFYVYLKRNREEIGVTLQRFTIEEATEKFKLFNSYQDAVNQLTVEELLDRDLESKKLELRRESMEMEHRHKLEQIELAKSQTQSKVEELEIKNRLEREKFERDLEQMKLEREELYHKLEMERDKARRDIEILTRKIELEELSNRRKDYYDERSYQRKDSSETIKWLPTLIVGATVLLKLL